MAVGGVHWVSTGARGGAIRIADMVWFIANQPPHININFLEVMCTAQIPARTNIVRKS